jgi:hypothetical protein
MTAKNQDAKGSDGKENAVSDEEVRQESSKAADQALAAQQEASKLKDAAAGASDADERQKLMEQAIDKQIEAESFGKTAKYMRSGAFQGLAMGTGLGVAPGASLGALTGTLVGGVTSTITGGLGGGLGAAVGAMHGPFVNLGEVAGKGIQKVTGNLPSWAASDEQKKTLEKMMGQVNEQDMPGKEELQKLKGDGGSGNGGKDIGSWAKSIKANMPSMSSQGKDDGERKKPRKLETRSKDSKAQSSDSGDGNKPPKLEVKSPNNTNQEAKTDDSQPTDKTDPKFESSQKSATGSKSGKGQPRKLEKRSP